MSEAPKSRRRVFQPGMVLLALVGVSLLGWAVANSPLFAARSVIVRGVRRLDPAEVRRLARVEPGANLLRVSLDRIAGSVERDPWVADATASRSLPSTLVISVDERRPVGWLQDGSGRVLVAADGVILERSSSQPWTFPWLGRAPSTLQPGARLPDTPVALAVARAMSDSVLPQTRAITTVGPDVVVDLRGGGEVLYGPPDRLQEKGRAVDSMLRWADQEGIVVATLDVRIPESPTLRPVP